jgi:hypothetical protein
MIVTTEQIRNKTERVAGISVQHLFCKGLKMRPQGRGRGHKNSAELTIYVTVGPKC